MWLRLRQIALVAHQLAPIAEQMRDIFGLEIGYRDPGVKVFGLENALFPVGGQFIEVVAPIQPNTAGGRYLERRKGDGGYMVITQCDDHAPRKRKVAELGIRKVLERDESNYCIMQLHPRDTGGSFLEIDFQAGDQSPDGPWAPAGKDWKRAVRTDVVRAIAAAEIQSPEPDALAERWSKIVEVPVKADALGHPSIRLENATIRFVRDNDGRGEGLAGLDLVTVNRPQAIKAAELSGHRISDDLVSVCGMRMRLVDN
jgi:glyoxalase-like protein